MRSSPQENEDLPPMEDIPEIPVGGDTPFELLTEEQKEIRLVVDALYKRLRF